VKKLSTLKYNRVGGINAHLVVAADEQGQDILAVYTLDPSLGEVEKAEAGEWGDIAPLIQSDLDFIAKQDKVATQTAIDNVYTAKIESIVGSIPQYEINTWGKQEAQALAYTSNNNAPVPFIQNLAIERSITLAAMAKKILEKAAIYEELSSKALGQKHAAEDAL